MTELVLTRSPSGALVPADAPSAEFIARLKVGAGLRGEFKRQRNPKFHRKAFALLQFAFDLWDAPALEYQGQPVEKNFDRFRRDIVILAGFFKQTVNLRGDVRLEAESLSFANMDEDRFSEVYAAILNVVWTRVLKSKGYGTAAEVDRVVAELLRFES